MTKHIYNVTRSSTATSVWQPYKNSGKTLPARVNNRALYGPILNQESLGSCSAFASTQWRMALYVLGGGTYERLSELADYYEERVLNNTVSSDSGATMQEAVQVLEQFGAMPEADDPYDPNYAKNFTQAPLNDWVAALKLLPSQAFYIGNNLDDVKDAAAQGMPIMFGIEVFAELEGGLCAQTGWLEMPADPSNSLGGHMVNIIGYDDDLQALLCLNQWGQDWGIHNDASLAGCFWMPYAYFTSYGFDAVAGIPDNGKPLQPQPIPNPFVKPVTDTYTITASASATSITLGQAVTVSGQTLCNGQPYPNASISYEFDDANGALMAATITSDANGKYSVSYTPKSADSIQAVVSFLDPYGDMPSAATDVIKVTAPSPTPQPTPNPSPAPQGGSQLLHLDCSTRLTAANVQALKSAGYKVIGRYLGAKTTTWSKTITPEELQLIHGAGMSVLLIWESSPTNAAYFTTAQGVADAKQAMEEMQYLGAPKTAAIYFVVDYDVQSSDMAAIEAYFKAIYEAVNGAYLVGAYGSYAVVSALWQTGYVDKFMQTYAWSVGQLFNGHVYQYQNNVTVSGINADLNAVFAAPGAWPEVTPQAPNLSSNPTVQSGSTGAVVQALQIALMRLGYSVVGSADGDFGPNTLSGVKAFQTAQKLTVDGIVGPATWGALDKAVGALKPPTPVPAPKPVTVTATPMKAQVNGVEVKAYDIGGVTFVEWSAIPGVKDTKTATGEWNFVTESTGPSSDDIQQALSLLTQVTQLLKG